MSPSYPFPPAPSGLSGSKYARLVRLVLAGASLAPVSACSDDSSSTSTETAGAAGTDTGGAAGDHGMSTAGTGTAGMGAAGMGTAGMGTAGMGTAGMGTAGPPGGALAGGGGLPGFGNLDLSAEEDDRFIYVARFGGFDASEGFAADRGEDTEGWADADSATLITPMLANGFASFTIPFTGADQSFGWNFDLQGAPVDTTGMELVVRFRSDQFDFPGGIQLYAWSNEWAGDTNSWTHVGEDDDFYEAVLDLDAADPDTGDGEPDFDKTQVNAVGFAFNTGSEGTEVTTWTFEVDYVALRLKEGDALAAGDGGVDPAWADAGVDGGPP